MVGSILANGQMIVETVKGHFKAVPLDEDEVVVDEAGEKRGRELEEVLELDIDGRGTTKRDENRRSHLTRGGIRMKNHNERERRSREDRKTGENNTRAPMRMIWIGWEPFHITLGNYEDTEATTQANMGSAAVDDGAEAA